MVVKDLDWKADRCGAYEMSCLFGTPKLALENGRAVWSTARHGGNRKLAADTNTRISAVAVLGQKGVLPPQPAQSVYHNPYAATRLPRNLFRGVRGVQQFRVRSAPSNRFASWVRC